MRRGPDGIVRFGGPIRDAGFHDYTEYWGKRYERVVFAGATHFTVTKNISVTALGYYDAFANGFTQSHAVGLWTSKGTLLGSVTVTNSAPLENFFRYVSLSQAVKLQAGQTYVVGGVSGSEDYQFDPTSITFASGITFDASAYISSGTLAFPNSSDNTPGYWGGSFLFGGGNSGPLLQNSDPIDIPTTADFSVIGQVQTGNPSHE